MKKFNKQLLIPILTLIALVAKNLFHIDIPDAAIDLSADLIMGAVSLAGFFIHPHAAEHPQTGVITTDEKPTVTIGDNR